jgi:uncharacterized membrane protein YeaQ/YmgE (transglycosylase-associated protein family)
MNIVLWTLAGGILGWVGHAFLGYNEARGKMVAIAIGAAGGLFGGKIIAPMFSTAAVPGDFSVAAMFFAAAVAAGFLFAGNFIHDRWGV